MLPEASLIVLAGSTAVLLIRIYRKAESCNAADDPANRLNAELEFEMTLNVNSRLPSKFSCMGSAHNKIHIYGSESSIHRCNSMSPSTFISNSTGSLGEGISKDISPTSSSSCSHKLYSIGTGTKFFNLGPLPWKSSHPFQRALLVLLFILTCALQTSAFVISPTRWQRRPRTLQLFSLMRQDDLLNECQKVIDSQPAVLVHLGDASLERIKWNGTVVALTDESNPGILPFVDRLATVTSMTRKLISNLGLAQSIYRGAYCNQRALTLVGSGAVYGAGKTTIGPVVCQCLESLASADQRVINGTFFMKPSITFHQLWKAVCNSVPELADLATSLEKDMPMTPGGLMIQTARYLIANNLVLFLHLDEFQPFDKLGNVKDERASFHNCWESALINILSTPRICLYISGRMPYYETLGAYPCRVHSAQLELFNQATICSALNKISIPGVEGSEGGTAALSVVLNTLPATAGASGTADVARRLHELTGGVPRFVDHAVRALLSDPTFGPALFNHNLSGISTTTLDRIFRRDGSVYTAAKEAAMSHFSGVLAEAGSEEARQQLLVGLMSLLLLRDTEIELSEEQAKDFVQSRSPLYPCPVVAHYLEEAHFWLIHRNIKKRDKGGGVLTFAVPPPMLDVLMPHLFELTTPDLQELTELDTSEAGTDAQEAAKLALTFHTHLTSLIPHSNWLGLSEDLPTIETGAVKAPRETSKAARTNVLTWEMPTLPTVDSRGTLHTVESLAEIAYGRNLTDRRMCSPSLLGKLLASLPPDSLHVFATTMWSASADFMVRFANDVTHLQVKSPQKFMLATYLDKAAQVAPIVQSSSDLNHTLVFVVTNPTGLANALSIQESLSSKEKLVSKLEARAALKEEKAKVVGNDAEKNKILVENLRAAAKLVREGRLAVKVLNEAQLGKFFRHSALKKFSKAGFFGIRQSYTFF